LLQLVGCDRASPPSFPKPLAQDTHNAKTYYLLAQAHFHASDILRARVEIGEALKLNAAASDFRRLSEQIEKASQ